MDELELYAGCDGLILGGIHIMPMGRIEQCIDDAYYHFIHLFQQDTKLFGVKE